MPPWAITKACIHNRLRACSGQTMLLFTYGKRRFQFTDAATGKGIQSLTLEILTYPIMAFPVFRLLPPTGFEDQNGINFYNLNRGSSEFSL